MTGRTATICEIACLEGHLFEVDAHDPTTYALVASLLLGTAAIASWWPARVAASIDPSTSLRAN